MQSNVVPSWSVTITERAYAQLQEHLFRDRLREGAAFLLVGMATTERGTRSLVRQVIPVAHEDFVAGDGSYRLSSRAVARATRRAREAGLYLLWAHSHPGATSRVAFSPQDHRTIEQAHPTMMDIVGGPVGALVFGTDAVEGELWLGEGALTSLGSLRVLGPKVRDLVTSAVGTASSVSERHARQVLLFGHDGQVRLRALRVAVVGVGGGGSIIVEQLARMGVGELILIDPDIVSTSNLSRIVGSRSLDALLKRSKVAVARRHVRRIDRSIAVQMMKGDLADEAVALRLADVDAIFIATDTALGRYAANALSFQYLIPAFQVGAKVQADDSGTISTIHTAERITVPGFPCLVCQHAIPPEQLHREQMGEVERKAQDYLGGAEDVEDPSVISLNSIPVGMAVTDFMLMFCGLLPDEVDLSARIWYPLERRSARRKAESAAGCGWCAEHGDASAFGRGDTWPLPLRRGSGRSS
jgi:hypothetical protein